MQRNGVMLGLALLNVALIAVVAWQARRLATRDHGPESAAATVAAPGARRVASAPSSLPETGSAPGAARESSRAIAPPSPPVAVAVAAGQQLSSPTNWPKFDWRQVESEDYRGYVRNLRAIGCPEQTIADIVSADLLQAFAARRARAVAAAYAEFQPRATAPDELNRQIEFERQRRSLDAELTGALRELLGQEVPAPDTAREWTAALLDRQLEFLPVEKRDAVRAALLREPELDHQLRLLSSNDRPALDPEELKRIMERYDALESELGQRLTPEEYEQLQSVTTFTGASVRRRLAEFQPTEEEFRFIFQAWRTHDVRLARLHALGLPDPGDLHEAVHERIREKLGEQRHAEYLRSWKP